MNITKRYMTKNRCYIQNKKIKPKGVIVHSDGCKAGIKAKEWFNRWNNADVSTCVHYFLDENETYNYLPSEKGNVVRAWGCGKGNKGSGNDTHIHFEICEPKDYKDKQYFNVVYKRAVKLTAFILKEVVGTTQVNEETVLCHSEAHKKGIASNHADVMHWFPLHNKTMNDFRKDVQTELNKSSTMYRVQVGAFSNKENAERCVEELRKKGITSFIRVD